VQLYYKRISLTRDVNPLIVVWCNLAYQVWRPHIN